MIGLDFRKPVRSICLEDLPDNLLDNQFLVKSCEIKEDLSQLSSCVSPVTIALPDISVLNMSNTDISDKKNHANIIWDQRDDKGMMFPKEKADKLLSLLKQHPLVIHAIDIESEAIARALRQLCDVNNKYFAILYLDNNSLWISIFKEYRKIFFYQENILDNNQEMIIMRGLKLFKIEFPELVIENYYAVGGCADKISNWGKIPDITKKLKFTSDLDKQLLTTDNTQWLLACGLSLWHKKSSWNLLPWRDREKKEGKKILFKYILKVILYSCGVILLLHGLLLLALHLQDEHNSVLDEKIVKLNTSAQTVNLAQLKINLLQSHIKTLEQISADQLLSSQFLENLSKSMPDGVFLNSLTLENKKISLTGRAETEVQANALLSKLKQNAIFSKPDLKNISQDESTPPYHFDFTIEMELA
jgi:type IV pilus assembly protein PilN